MPLFGVPLQRDWVDIETIEKFLVVEWPTTVIELGTGTGAFSLFLACYCATHGHKFRTYDTGLHTHEFSKPRQTCLDAIGQLGGVVRKADVFDPGTVEEIRSHLTSPSFIYCDNGDKPLELATYSKIVPVGSFIGVHDYGHEIHDITIEGFDVWREHLFDGSTNDVLSYNRILKRVF